MDAVVRVAEVNGVQELVEHPLDERLGTALRVLLEVVEHGAVAVLEHEVQLPVALEHLDQVHEVRVLEHLKASGKLSEVEFHS